MSTTTESPDGLPLQSQYSLRWNNHQTHILQAFEALLHQELLVDVTLVCAEVSFKAHKIVLSICSPFFERIFSEHQCKHPLIVLKDFRGPEVAALIDFMYRGEVRVGRNDLPDLMQAAESLQIRGLASSVPRPASPPETPTTDILGEPSTPETSRQPLSLDGGIPEEDDENILESAAPPVFTTDHRLPHMSHLNFSLRELRENCSSPLMPRRKQARPRRRSGELVPQDLSRPHPPRSLSPPSVGLNLSSNSQQQQSLQAAQQRTSPLSQIQQEQEPQQQQIQQEDMAENLSMKKEPKKSVSPSTSAEQMVKSESEEASSIRGSPLNNIGLHSDVSFSDLPTAGLTAMSVLRRTPPQHPSNEYLASLGQFAAQWLPPNHQNHLGGGSSSATHPRHPRVDSPHGKSSGGYAYQQSESPLAPRSAFPLEGLPPLSGGPGLFSHSAPLDLHDSFKHESFHGLLMGARLGHHQSTKKSKKHRGDGLPRRWSDHAGMPVMRPKGQHSAPRGGPPRSWTNLDLTEALTMVWNKKMTTSQASRVYGIPYNSLLMYVRGKYGKSLKLEQLRRDCAAGEVMNSLNNNVKLIEQPPPNQRVPSLPALPRPPADTAEPSNFAHHPALLSGALGQGYYPDFTNFPIPVNMVHLVPPSEQSANPQDMMMAGSSRSPSPLNVPAAGAVSEGAISPSVQSAPAMIQQNGSG